MAITSPSVLPGNILTLADSDLESGTITWAADTNASSVAASGNHAYAGAKSVTWNATAAGDSIVASGFYPCTGSKGYDVSGHITTPAGCRDTFIGARWYNSSHTLISSAWGNDNPTHQNWGFTVQPGGGFFGFFYFLVTTAQAGSISVGDTFTWSGQAGAVFTVTDIGVPSSGVVAVSYTPTSSSAIGSGTVTQDIWQPVVAAVTSPVNAAFFKVACWVSNNVQAGEGFAADLFYAAKVPAQVLIDWSNPSFEPGSAAGTDFEDVTPWVRWDENISLTRGRQDAVSEMQTGQATVTLQNDTGWFTPQNSASPYYYSDVTLGRRLQINAADQSGNWSTRFDGAVSEITYTVDVTGDTNVANVAASDVLAYLSRQDARQCWTKETIIGDTPWLHWTLDDNGETGVGAETSGNNGPVLRVYSGGGIQWDNSNGGVETLADAVQAGQPDGSAYWTAGQVAPSSLTRGLASGVPGPFQTPLGSIYFTPTLTAQTAQNLFVGNSGAYLQAELIKNGVPIPVSASSSQGYTLEAWFTEDPTIKADLTAKYGPYVVLSLGSTRTGSCLVAGLYLTGSALNFEVATYSQPPAFSMNAWSQAPTALQAVAAAITADAKPLPHHMVIQIQGGSATVYIDNVDIGFAALPAGTAYDTIVVGAAYGTGGNYYGNISCVSIYQYILSPQQIATHCMAGQYGYWEQPTDNCIAALADIAGIPGFWNNTGGQNNNGLTLTEYLNIAGSNALSSMQLYEQAERGLLFVNSAGQLGFHTRDWRMGYGAPDVTLPADVYSPDLSYELVDTTLLNQAAVSTAVFTTGVGWIGQDSANSYGSYANGTQQSPVQLPLITWSRAYTALGLPPWQYWADPNLNDSAAWQVNSRSQPTLICGQLTVDLLTLDPTSGLTVAQLYALDVDNMVALSGVPGSFPNQAGALDYFIEGVNETIGLSEHTLSFYTSPASTQRAWKAGDATYGQLDTTTRIGISAADLSTPPSLGKTVAHDAGLPYWPPNFQTPVSTYQLGFVNATALSPVLTPGNFGQGYSLMGDCLIAEVMAPAAATISVSDSQGNTYTQIASVALTTGARQYIFAAFSTQPLNSSDTVTFTTSVNQAYAIALFGMSGVTAVDGTPVTATATSSSPSITPGTMSAGNDIELVVFFNSSTLDASIPSGWTQMGRNFSGSEFDKMYWRQATSTSGDTCSATYPSSVPWGAIAITLTVAPYAQNNPAGNGHSFVGASDIRGIRDTIATALTPPLLVVGAVTHNQTFASGGTTISAEKLVWDNIYIDTAGGMGIVGGWPNWYVVTVPGYYEVSASLIWDLKSSGAAGIRCGWIVIAAQAAQSGNPFTVNQYIVPIGEQVGPNNFTVNPVCCPTVRVYLGIGDMISLGAMQSQGANDGTGTNFNGSLMSLRWLGFASANDRFPYSPGAPGNGNTPPSAPGQTRTFTKTYSALHTYSYYGTSTTFATQRRNTDGSLYQGQYPRGQNAASQFSFAAFDHATIATNLTGATVNNVKVKMTNQGSWYNTGASLMVGYTTFTGTFGTSFSPGGGTVFDMQEIWFKKGQTITADITRTGIGAQLKAGTFGALAFGNNASTNPLYYGWWAGGTAPQLIVTYTR